MKAIEVENLTRRFSDRVAVDGISFTVERGEVFGFLGPNGAGKTTTINVLTGQLNPTAGAARLLGHDVTTDRAAIKSLVGVVFEEQNVYERFTGRENLGFSARLHGRSREAVDTALATVGLSERARDRVAHYSNGMRQRLVIARALLHEPRILFLDEPSRGLDPSAAREVRALIERLAREGVTIFLTTHDMDDADRLCDRVAIVDRGRIIATDSPKALKLTHATGQAKVILDDQTEEVHSLQSEPGRSRLAALIADGRVLAVHSLEGTLEDAFIAMTGRRLAE